MNKSASGGKEAPLFKVSAQKIMLYALLGGLSALFIALTVAYLFTKSNWRWVQFAFPKAFWVSTLALAASSYTIQQALAAYKVGKGAYLLQMLGFTLTLSVLFIGAQMLGWYDLYHKGIYLGGKPDGSYLYLLTGLHVLHGVAGLGGLMWLYADVRKNLHSSTLSVFYFMESAHRQKIELTALYWHFVDAVWLYLLLFFVVNHW